MGVSLQIINLQTELNYLDSVNIFKIFSVLTWSHPPINQPNHPPTHQAIHPPMGGEFFTDFKSLNGIEISWLVQALSNFYWFWGSTPLGDGRWVDGSGGGYGGVGGVSHTHTHAHACRHTCTCMLNMLIMLNMDASMSVAICNFYTCIHVCMCVCMHVCGGTPPMPPDAPDHPHILPPPQSYREPKTAKFNKSWTNHDNWILFEDSLPLNISELI